MEPLDGACQSAWPRYQPQNCRAGRRSDVASRGRVALRDGREGVVGASSGRADATLGPAVARWPPRRPGAQIKDVRCVGPDQVNDAVSTCGDDRAGTLPRDDPAGTLPRDGAGSPPRDDRAGTLPRDCAGPSPGKPHHVAPATDRFAESATRNRAHQAMVGCQPVPVDASFGSELLSDPGGHTMTVRRRT
jgi:hypothetical protein